MREPLEVIGDGGEQLKEQIKKWIQENKDEREKAAI